LQNNNLKIIVLGGGISPEREVSLRSANAIYEATKKAGFDTTLKDPADGLEFLSQLDKNTIILPILHGVGGEDGEIQSELEKYNLPFLGSGSEASTKCFDKWQTRIVLQANKIPVAQGEKVTKSDIKYSKLANKPHVIKILRGGSSIGTLIVRDSSRNYNDEINKLFTLDDEAVIEELIDGIEITVPILDNSALPVIEIVPPKGLEFDYENKYNGMTNEICPPKNINQELQQQAQKLAEQVHKVMECRHLSRVDMMVDRSGHIYVLEINTMPGLTDQSLYPKAAAVSGLTMPQLVNKFIQLVARDYGLKLN